MIFDSLTLLCGVADLLLYRLEGASALQAVRIFRVSRILRVVRLIRVVRDLYIVLSTLTRSLQVVVGGAFMIFLFSSLFALLTLEFADTVDEYQWGSFLKSCLTFVQITSYDDHTNIVRQLVQDGKNQWFWLVYVLFTALTSIGICNVVVGMVVRMARNATVTSFRFEHGVERIRHLISMRILVSQLESNGLVSRAHLLSLFPEIAPSDREGESIEFMDTGFVGMTRLTNGAIFGLEPKLDPPSVEETMRLALKGCGFGRDEIHCIFDTVATVRNEAQSGHLFVEEFIDGCMCLTGEMGSLDVVGLICGLRSAHLRLDNLVHLLSDLCKELESTTAQHTKPYLEHFEEPQGQHAAQESPTTTHTTDKSNHAVDNDVHLNEMRYQSDRRMLWTRFNVMFMIICFISVFCDSLEFAVHMSWIRIIDVIAVCSFTSELFLRVCTTYQVDEHQELGMSFCVVPNIIAKLNRRLIGNILRRTVPVMIWRPLFIIDLVIVVVGIIGLIFTFQGASLPRAFILLWICKLGRLLNVVLRDRQLYVLLTGESHVFSTVVWSIVILWCFNYTVATFMVQMFGQHSSHAGDDSLQNCWNNLQRSIRTLVHFF